VNLTIAESHKIDLIRSESDSIRTIIKQCDVYLEFMRDMKQYYFKHCSALDNKDRKAIRQEISSTNRLKKDYKARLIVLRDLSSTMESDKYKMYDSNCRVYRFADKK
jgi:hypothetical protein